MGVEGFVNVRSTRASVNVICFESCVLYSSGLILCCVRGSFHWRFMGGRFPKWTVSFLLGNPYFAEERNDSCVCSLLAR